MERQNCFAELEPPIFSPLLYAFWEESNSKSSMDQMMAQVQMLRNAKNRTNQSFYCQYFDSLYRHQLLSVITVINRAKLIAKMLTLWNGWVISGHPFHHGTTVQCRCIFFIAGSAVVSFLGCRQCHSFTEADAFLSSDYAACSANHVWSIPYL